MLASGLLVLTGRCMAASVLLVIGNQQDLIDAIVAKASKITPGQDSAGEMGPVIVCKKLIPGCCLS